MAGISQRDRQAFQRAIQQPGVRRTVNHMVLLAVGWTALTAAVAGFAAGVLLTLGMTRG